MAKKVEQQRVAKVGNNMQLEQMIASDDSLLPTPKELVAYQDIDKNIIPWLLEHTANEQAHRHETDKEKLALVRKSLNTDKTIIALFFIIVFVFIGLSAFFVYIEKNVSGSIFGLCGLVGAYVLYDRFLKVKNK